MNIEFSPNFYVVKRGDSNYDKDCIYINNEDEFINLNKMGKIVCTMDEYEDFHKFKDWLEVHGYEALKNKEFPYENGKFNLTIICAGGILAHLCITDNKQEYLDSALTKSLNLAEIVHYGNNPEFYKLLYKLADYYGLNKNSIDILKSFYLDQNFINNHYYVFYKNDEPYRIHLYKGDKTNFFSGDDLGSKIIDINETNFKDNIKYLNGINTRTDIIYINNDDIKNGILSSGTEIGAYFWITTQKDKENAIKRVAKHFRNASTFGDLEIIAKNYGVTFSNPLTASLNVFNYIEGKHLAIGKVDGEVRYECYLINKKDISINELINIDPEIKKFIIDSSILYDDLTIIEKEFNREDFDNEEDWEEYLYYDETTDRHTQKEWNEVCENYMFINAEYFPKDLTTSYKAPSFTGGFWGS